ncbi:MAG: DoxX family membrane protein [Acidobacteria bacterium]|nr:DoxX family membrane protein [Acidobacteriota bacterium]NIM60519.1 DoxX family membrane protein [Acidobacteriota bacterium]NIO59490.1 DoxX family membrane protein [Acidobacteriota bacterium]NIQ30519.1 DoxX family membrane protein [Acidobacteriota bacterium]NIQ85467.1 DoxX family membrane protein [Acidobacteriota bacterium]
MKTLIEKLSHPLLVRLAGIAIGLVFVVAGLAKIGDMSTFATQVHNFRLTPVALENLVAMTLPWIEVVAGTALILGVRRRGAAWICAGLMVVFTLAVGQAAARGLDFECGCFGKGDASTVGVKKLIENVGLTVVALIATLRRRS